MIELLLKNGAKPHLEDKRDETPIEYSKALGRKDLVKLMRRR